MGYTYKKAKIGMRSSTPISCSKQGQLKEAAQAPVQSINMDGKSTPCPISL